MVLSSALTVTADGERLSCGGFSLGETIHFGSIKFIIDLFGGLSLSPLGDGLDAIVMGSTRGRPPSPLRATMGDSTKEFHTTSDGEGRTYLLSPRRHHTGASPTSATTISRSESTPPARASTNIQSCPLE
jgi:hypothetical protein